MEKEPENIVSDEAIELFLKDIREVCAKHGLGMLGSCNREGIYGEIEIDFIDVVKDSGRSQQVDTWSGFDKYIEMIIP